MNLEHYKFLNHFDKINLTPVLYWQMAAVSFCLILTYFSYKIFRKSSLYSFLDSSKADENFWLKVIRKFFLPIIWPIAAILFLGIGASIFNLIYQESDLFAIFIEVGLLLLFLRFLKVLFGNSLISNLMAIILIPVVVLSILGLLEPTTLYLDSFAVQIGSVRISIYGVIKGLFTLLILFWISNFFSKKVKHYVDANKLIKSSTKGIISKIIDLLIYFTVFVVTLRVFGVDMTTLAVIGGAIGVGIGFGLQKIASNFISGIILVLEKSVEVGDLIELDDGTLGTMTYFGGRYIIVETSDGKEIMVPNEDLITKRVNNLTYNNSRGRIEIKVSISYDSDVKKALELMLQAAREHPKCLRYPSIDCFVTEFASSGINIVLYFWISNVVDGRAQPKSDVMISILDKFNQHGIIIPYPMLDIRVKGQVLSS